jgi:hypothetical protein
VLSVLPLGNREQRDQREQKVLPVLSVLSLGNREQRDHREQDLNCMTERKV